MRCCETFDMFSSLLNADTHLDDGLFSFFMIADCDADESQISYAC